MAILKKKKATKVADQVDASFEEDWEDDETTMDYVDTNLLVPTSCVPFNLECSGEVEGAFLLGKIVNLIGDSHAGKTLFALSVFAECSMDKRFDDYRFIYDDVEAACEFNIQRLFGKKCKERLDTSIRSRTIEQFNDNVAGALDDDQPFIYVLDSFDGLTSESAIELDAENRKKRAKGADTKGSFGDGKAKYASSFFSLRTQELSDKKSVVIIISQTRDNIGFGAMFNPKTRSGGKALKFYSFHEIWLSMEKKEKKGDRTYITNVQARITKNKVTGRHGVAHFPILFDYGVDNITSCIYFLLKEKYWTKDGKFISTKGFHPNPKISYNDLVAWIEKNDKEHALALECKAAYDKVIADMIPRHRKKKYI